MPARSTLRQRVVFHIQRQLVDYGTVEESSLLPDRHSGSNREVDVVIRTKVAEHDVIVCVECRDQRRKATVEWVEQMAMKHRSLPTSKLILVSTPGFTRTAGVKADSLGIDIYSFDEALATDWKTLFGDEEELDIYLWSFRILGCGLVLDHNEEVEYAASPETRIYDRDNAFKDTLIEVVRAYTERSSSFTEKAVKYAQNAKESVFGADLRIRPALFVEDESSQRHEIKALRIYIETREPTSAVSLSPARFRESQIAYGQGQTGSGDFELTLIQSPHGPATGAMSITDPTTRKVQTVDVWFPQEEGKIVFLTGSIRGRPAAGLGGAEGTQEGQDRSDSSRPEELPRRRQAG